MSENVREPKDLDIIIQIQNAIGKLINDVERDEKQYELNLSQYLNWKNSLTDAALSEASGLVVEHEASLSKRRKHIDAEQKAVAEVIETLGENILNCTLIEIQSILKQDNLSFSGKKLLPVWAALLRGFDSLRKPDITPTLIKEVQSFVDDGLIHPAHNEVKRHFALSKAREIITGCRELNNQQQTSTAADQEPKTPGGFIGFCYRKICELPAETRSAFLAINRGDQTYYSYRDEWPKEYGKKILKPGDMISKAKRHYREQNKN